MELTGYKKGDEKQIVKLLKLSFDRWPFVDLDNKSRKYWEWKYHDTLSDLVSIRLAWDENILLGCDHFYFNHVKVGDKTVLCGIGTDTAVHPDHRKKGIYSKMDELRDRELTRTLSSEYPINIVYWITTNPIFIESAIRRGHPTFPYQIMNMVRVKNVRKYLHETNSDKIFLKEVGLNALIKFQTLKNSVFRDNYIDELTRLREIDSFDERINAFYKEIEPFYSFIVKRDQEYLNYRYCDPRAGRFKVKIVENDDEILGFIVTKTRKDRGLENGFIVDLLTKPGRIDVADTLLSDSLIQFDANGINVVKSWVLKDHPFDRLFHRKGFINQKKSMFIGFHQYSLDEEWRKLLESRPENVHFSMGDLDII
jgi:hypothetical protein